MKKILAPVIIFLFLFSVPALAKKSDTANPGKVSVKQRENREETKTLKEKSGEDLKEEKGEENLSESENQNRGDTLKGLEKQREKKTEQVQKELEKGSEQGQESRQERKKWWKFWGD